ncbi:MAG: MFS transporter [Proteobacteria bacterium]|nr:MFS transporter [Pseudomonadota bacterium]
MGDPGEIAKGEYKIRPKTNIAALLADGDFARVWGAGALFGVARWLETLAVGIFVIDLTGSAAVVAVVGSMRMLPLLLLGAVVGTLANRFSRRTLLLAGTAVAGLSALSLGLLALAGAIAVWQIAIGSFLTGVLWATDHPVRRTMMADIAGQARTGTAMSLEASASHVTRLVGVGLGGLLVGTVGVEGAYLLGAALYALVIILLMGIGRREAPTPGLHRNLLADTVGGLRILAAERFLLAVLAVTIIFNFFGFAYFAMVPVIGRAVLHVDAFAIGLLSATEAAASLVVSLVFAARAPRRSLGALYALGVLVLMGGILIFALSSSYWLSLAVMGVTGAAMGSYSVAQSTLTLLASPPALRTRAMGALAICIGLAPLGMLHLGWLAEHLGAPAAVAISAAEGAAAVIAVMLLFPRILTPDLPGAGGTGVVTGTGRGAGRPEAE